ncbi:MAG TPA: valine--tRNA ligase, partial [Frankiaceae bacterium]|nr:valine--tRNA ligase [Frankiaceae bacterium]
VLVGDTVLASYVEQAAALAGLHLSVAPAVPDGWRVLALDGAVIALDLSDTVDVAAERARLGKAAQAARKEVDQLAAKLANPAFVERAPAPVVDTTRRRLADARAELARAAEQLATLGP